MAAAAEPGLSFAGLLRQLRSALQICQDIGVPDAGRVQDTLDHHGL